MGSNSAIFRMGVGGGSVKRPISSIIYIFPFSSSVKPIGSSTPFLSVENSGAIKNKNDNKILKKEIVNQIYIYPEKKIIVVSEIGFAENYLIYIDKIENAKIGADSNEYKKFLNLSKAKIISDLYNTYDNYIKERYEIDINYQALDIVKNYYN